MRTLVLTVVFAVSLIFAPASFAQMSRDGNHGGAPGSTPGHAPGAGHPAPHSPSYQVHPGARGFVHRPMWRHPGHVAQHSHFHFRFRGHTFVVLGGPIFYQPWVYYPYVSTPYYPASFYDPNDPGAGYSLYYCPNPAGYFPDVTDCPSGWWSTAPDDAQEMQAGY